MQAALIVTLLVAATPAERLAAFITKRNRKAKPYAALLAKRILIEAKRHQLKAHEFAAVAYVESDFRTSARGRHGEHGIWQVQLDEYGAANAWQWMRSNPTEFPLAMKWGAMPWKSLAKGYKVAVIRSVREGTYMAASAIAAHVAVCKRAGHRIGRGYCRNTPKGLRCIRRHRYEIDRLGHWNSGGLKWPGRGYLRKLRGRSRIIKLVLQGR